MLTSHVYSQPDIFLLLTRLYQVCIIIYGTNKFNCIGGTYIICGLNLPISHFIVLDESEYLIVSSKQFSMFLAEEFDLFHIRWCLLQL